MQRRTFLRTTSRTGLGLGLLGTAGLLTGCGNDNATTESTDAAATDQAAATATTDDLWFKISLAQWSLNKQLFGGELDNLDFARKTREDFGLGGVEYVNQFFKDKATDMAYLGQMKQRAADHGVESLLIMIDGEGDLGSTSKEARMQAVENHHKWVDAAKFLGCHSIRVNAAGEGTAAEVGKAAIEGLSSLGAYAGERGMNVIVENHGGYSSNGQWLADVIKSTEMSNVGTLPDFGNFCITREEGNWRNCLEEYDRYKGLDELMPFAKAVSAKTNFFDANGDERESDYYKLLATVKQHGYRGWIGIEYEGDEMSADEGIRKTIDLLRKAGAKA